MFKLKLISKISQIICYHATIIVVLVTKRKVLNARNRTYDVYGHYKVQHTYWIYSNLPQMVLKFVIVDVMGERHRFSDAWSTAWSSVFSVLTGWVNSLKKEIIPDFRNKFGQRAIWLAHCWFCTCVCFNLFDYYYFPTFKKLLLKRRCHKAYI